MTGHTDSQLQDPERETVGTVRQIAVPPDARALSTLSQIDYEDAFLVQTGPGQDRTGEQWARAMLEGAPLITRTALLSGWSSLGLRLSSPLSDECVLGWEVRQSTPEFVLLGAGSRLGIAGELLFVAQERTLLFCTFVKHDNAVARAAWVAIEPVHVQVVARVLERGARSASA